ncbi:MmpS family transport accessory protein [Lentzea sp. BCCO 10_0798]|uniref:MmpS family transport accessory protein n=1 Tax=Lentzea kristufekii TaxID=3095430 RepID=A0ABU4TQ51_9PSEU|nr:MmpS family transport accessory protein [Lentzea sp. BCCO 10_0798]MDX8050393.1 MmpS family transport accessory protein [Lentzea sp. BCCO 10_0798]
MSQQPPGQQQPYPPQYPQQPQYMPQPQPPKKKSKKGWFIGIGVLVLLLIIGAALGGGRPSGTTANTPAGEQPTAAAQPTAAQQPAAPAVRTVVYEVTGTGTANNITYNTDGLTSTQQETNVKLPWSKTVEMKAGEAFQMATLLAQNGPSGEITVKITVDGKLVKDGKSSGPYAVVNVSENIGSFK